MKDTLIPAAALVGVGAGLAVAPIPEVGFVLQGAGLGALVGTGVAQWRKGRGARIETGAIIARWTLVGAAFATVFAVVDGFVRGVT